jgi:hypothetical protein
MAQSTRSASAEVEKLESFQRKSAAIETVFTLAVLYIGILQVIPLNGLYQYAALIPVIVLLIIALHLGWENLWNQIVEG